MMLFPHHCHQDIDEDDIINEWRSDEHRFERVKPKELAKSQLYAVVRMNASQAGRLRIPAFKTAFESHGCKVTAFNELELKADVDDGS